MNQKQFTRQLAGENALKNLLAIAFAMLAYPFINQSLSGIDASALANFLLVVSILLVTVCFANFAFTYEKARMATRSGRLLAHSTTGIFMFLIAALLESVALGVHIIYPSLSPIIVGFTALLYIGLALYDFWDLLKVEAVA